MEFESDDLAATVRDVWGPAIGMAPAVALREQDDNNPEVGGTRGLHTTHVMSDPVGGCSECGVLSDQVRARSGDHSSQKRAPD